MQGKHDAVKGLIPIETYIETMKAQKQLAAGVKRVRFFLATDDAEAEAQIRAAFKPGAVLLFAIRIQRQHYVFSFSCFTPTGWSIFVIACAATLIS